RQDVVARWRQTFAAATLSAAAATDSELPRCAPNEQADLLGEWNSTRASVDGDAVANLIVLAERLGFRSPARKLLRRRKLGVRLLAIQTLGHLRDRTEWSAIAALLDHPNTALSVTAAAALLEIDAVEGLGAVMPLIVRRADWPQTS